jgi:glycosyltransferase involved in cell wall biosynthesis
VPKICFLADASSPHTSKWVSGCLELNWEITVISHWPGEIPGAKVIVHPLSLTGFPKYCWSIRRLIRKIKPDIIHAHQFGAHALYAWFSGVSPLIISAWGSDVLVKPKQSLFIRALMEFLIPKASLITTDSDQVNTELIAYGAKPEQLLTVLFGIDRQSFQKLAQATKDDARLIICSPRLHEPLYNIQEIIRAFIQVKRDLPQIELWLLGDGSLTTQLQQYVPDNQLALAVRFWGRVTPQEFSERLAESNLMISIPSSDGTPVSLLEAMAAGCLPILSDLPVYHDWVMDGVNGLIVKSDFSDLVAVLLRGIQDKNLRQEAATINRKLIKERGIWQEQFQPMLEYYKAKVYGG